MSVDLMTVFQWTVVLVFLLYGLYMYRIARST